MIKVSIIGIGQVGSAVANLLISRNDIQLNLRDPGNIDGRFIDLKDAAGFYQRTIHINNIEELENSDYIIYCAGFCNKKNESRETVTEANNELATSLFEGLNLKETATIIVITNPVEKICQRIYEIVSSEIQVIGTGTYLDTIRLSVLLSQKFNCLLEEVQTKVIGEHGSNMIPLWSHTLIKGQCILEKISSEELNKLEIKLKKIAFKIRETEVATKYGIAHCAIMLMDSLINTNENRISCSLRLFKNSNSYLTYPCIIKNGRIYPNRNLVLNPLEQERLNNVQFKL